MVIRVGTLFCRVHFISFEISGKERLSQMIDQVKRVAVGADSSRMDADEGLEEAGED